MAKVYLKKVSAKENPHKLKGWVCRSESESCYFRIKDSIDYNKQCFKLIHICEGEGIIFVEVKK